MSENNIRGRTNRILPSSQYIDIRLPDGSHSGVRVDSRRGVLEIQRKGVRYYFDLVQVAETTGVANTNMLTTP